MRSIGKKPGEFATLSAPAGSPVAWVHRVSGSSIFARIAPGAMQNGVDPDGVEGAAHPPYKLPAIQVEFNQVEPQGVLTSWWRGVGPSHNVFMVESFIDELAAAAKADPVDYRKRLLTDNPRALKVLELAAEKAEWGKPLSDRQGHCYSATVTAQGRATIASSMAIRSSYGARL